MMNKPVAWMSPDGKVSDTEGKLFYIPLYTHPVKEQELLGEIAHLKHINKNWSISEGWLKQKNDKLKAELDTANKAYMWMDETYKGVLAELESLKAHPVKELTDEEIIEISKQYFNENLHHSLYFAKAILRKAQNK